jgi:hypothetical protein
VWHHVAYVDAWWGGRVTPPWYIVALGGVGEPLTDLSPPVSDEHQACEAASMLAEDMDCEVRVLKVTECAVLRRKVAKVKA